MNDEVTPLEALRELGEALAMGPARAALALAADLLVDHLPGRAATVVIGESVQAEVGFPLETHAELARAGAFDLARHVEEIGRLVEVADTRRGPFAARDTGVRLHASGYTGALAMPIHGRDRTLGMVVVWLDELHHDTKRGIVLLECVVHQLSVALTRDRLPTHGDTSLSSLGEMNRLASLGLLIDSSLHALRAPSSALLIQIDELQRLTSELAFLVDPTDSALVDVLREIRSTVDDMGLSSSAVRKELLRMSDASEGRAETETLKLSLVLHEAVRIARPELEQLGFTLSETFAKDGSFEGDRHEYVQAFLGLFLALGRDPNVHGRFPLIEVHLGGDDTEATITITARASMSHFLPPLAATPDASLATIRRGRGEVTEGLGSFTVRLPLAKKVARASDGPSSPSVAPRARKVLLVDDDPMFARALRRALTPHDVKLCGTAAEAEIALLEPGYTPDLVICDLWLPGTSGRALHEKIAGKTPALSNRFLFVSGAPMTSRDLEYFGAHECRSLTKPIAIEDILAVLHHEERADLDPHF